MGELGENVGVRDGRALILGIDDGNDVGFRDGRFVGEKVGNLLGAELG